MPEEKDIFCPLPWSSICVQPYGPALCCSSYVDLRKTPEETPAEVYKNERMTEVRRKFLANEWPSECHTCKINESSGIMSLRELTIRTGKYDDILALKDQQRKKSLLKFVREKFLNAARILSEKPLPMRFLELASSNFCNLKCRMCGPRYSTKWKEDIDAVEASGFAGEMEPINGLDDNPLKDFNALALYDLLDEEPFVMMKGGEPMLNKNNADLIEILAKTGKIKNTHLAITTNGIFLAEWFLKYLQLFKSVHITFSIDASGPLNKYIRYGNYQNEDLKINMERIRNQRSDTIIVVSTAFQIYNMLNYPDLVHDYSAFCDHFSVTLTTNYQLNPQKAPDELRELSMKRIRKLIKTEKVQTVRQTYEDILRFLEHGEFDPAAWKKFIAFTRALDEIRSEKLEDIEPELAAFIQEQFQNLTQVDRKRVR